MNLIIEFAVLAVLYERYDLRLMCFALDLTVLRVILIQIPIRSSDTVSGKNKNTSTEYKEMYSQRQPEVPRVRSCPQRLEPGRFLMDTTHNSEFEITRRSRTAGSDQPQATWYYIAGKKSGSHHGCNSIHGRRWATRQADWRIRNGTSGYDEIVHRNEEKNEKEAMDRREILDASQTNRNNVIQDRDKVTENGREQTNKRYIQVVQRKPPHRRGQKHKKSDDIKIKSLMSVYMNEGEKHQRHERLLNKIEEMQISEGKTQQEHAAYKQEERRINWKRQVENLRKIRQRFDDEQTVRFQKQFVSWKSVEKYRYNKSNYGLPDVLPNFKSVEGANLEVQHCFRPIERDKLRNRNLKRYRNILDPSLNNIKTLNSIKQTLHKPNGRNTTVLKEAQELLFSSEMDFSSVE